MTNPEVATAAEEQVHEPRMKVLFTAEQIRVRVAELATQLTADFEGETPILIGMLKGSYIFLGDLSRAITIPHHIDFMAIAAYGSERSPSGAVRLLKDLSVNITGRVVLIVEDIIDSGMTLAYIRRILEARQPKRLAVVTLLDKTVSRKCEVPIEYVGFEVGDGFVVGYGLDLAERYRHLPYIALLDPSRGEENR